MAALKSKRLSEGFLKERVESLSQLEEVYSKIAQAADQVAILRVLEGSTLVLRNLHNETGGTEKVERLIEELGEETHRTNEVGQIIQGMAQDNAFVDDDRLNEELESMLRDTKAQEGRQTERETQQQVAELETIQKVPSKEPIPNRHAVPVLTGSDYEKN